MQSRSSRYRTLTWIVVPSITLLSTSCHIEPEKETDPPQANGSVGVTPTTDVVTSEGLPISPFRREFLVEAQAMVDGPMKDLAVEYAANLYDVEDVVESHLSATGATVDCINLDRQPALRRIDGTFDALGSPPPDPVDLYDGLNLNNDVGTEPTGCPDHSMFRFRADNLSFLRFVAERQRPPAGGKRGALPTTAPPVVTKKWYGSAPYGGNGSGYEHARATQSVANQGIVSTLSVYQPAVASGADRYEHSISQVWLMGQNGQACANADSSGVCQSIEVGWRVYHHYPNETAPVSNEPHLFIFSTPDNYRVNGRYCWVGSNMTDCLNFRFYQMGGPAFEPEQPLAHSTLDSPTPENHEIKVTIQRYGDSTWHIWLNHTFVGEFLPAAPTCMTAACQWFTSPGLLSGSNLIRFGGEVINENPLDTAMGIRRHTTTNMGTGQYASQWSGTPGSPGLDAAAYQRGLGYYENVFVSATPPSLDVTSDSTPSNPDNDYNHPGCYSLTKGGTPYSSWPAGQNHIFFGGPGLNGTQCE